MQDTKVQKLSKFLAAQNLTLVEILFSSSRSCVVSVRNQEKYVSVLKIRPAGNSLLSDESKALEYLQHPNIVKKIAFYENTDFSVLQLEKVEGEALIDYVKAKGPLSEEELKPIAQQLVSLLMYLKSKNLVYLDLKPDNLIYNSKTKQVTLIDFELALKWSRWKTFKTPLGTREYSAPEVERGKFKGPEAEIWTLGLTLYLLLRASFPEWETIQDENKKSKKSRVRLVCPSTLSENCCDLLSKMLEIDVSKRVALKNVETHAWLLPSRSV